MLTQEERLLQLDKALSGKAYVCSSGGILTTFPPSLKLPYHVNGIGLVVCRSGSFRFEMNGREYTANAGETLFIPEYSFLQVSYESPDLEIAVLIYQIEPIRDIIGNLVLSMFPYSKSAELEPCNVWNTGEEEEVMRYMQLLDDTVAGADGMFSEQEQKLLLLALTHRLCSIYSRRLLAGKDAIGRKHEVFMRLVQLVESNYMRERSVDFYADKLCLSPKYLSALAKSVCGYTVQEIVFKAIVRKSISLLCNTQKSIQEISDELNFPNASYFGTFFRKQVGMAPLQYRKRFV